MSHADFAGALGRWGRGAIARPWEHPQGTVYVCESAGACAAARVRVGVRERMRASLKVLALSSCSPRALASRLLRCCSQNLTLPCPPHAWPSCLLPAGAPGRVQVPGKADGVPRRRSETVWGSFVVAREGCFSTYVARSLYKTKKTFMCLCST